MTISAGVKQWNIADVYRKRFRVICTGRRRPETKEKHPVLAILPKQYARCTLKAKSIHPRSSFLDCVLECVHRNKDQKSSLSNNSGRGTTGTNWILTLVLLHLSAITSPGLAPFPSIPGRNFNGVTCLKSKPEMLGQKNHKPSRTRYIIDVRGVFITLIPFLWSKFEKCMRISNYKHGIR